MVIIQPTSLVGSILSGDVRYWVLVLDIYIQRHYPGVWLRMSYEQTLYSLRPLKGLEFFFFFIFFWVLLRAACCLNSVKTYPVMRATVLGRQGWQKIIPQKNAE